MTGGRPQPVNLASVRWPARSRLHRPCYVWIYVLRARVARAWKLLLALAAVLGCWSFVEPIERHALSDGRLLEVSAYRIARGFQDAADVDPAAAELASWRQARVLEEANLEVQYQHVGGPFGRLAINPLPLLYACVGVLALLALFALSTRVLGPFGATASMVMGFAALSVVVSELVQDRHAPLDTYVGSGGTLLALCGALAMLSGLGALVLPDPGGFTTAPREPQIPVAHLRRGGG